MNRDYSYRAAPRIFLQYRGGVIYTRVPEAAVRAILNAAAGEIVENGELIDDRSVI